ncbi:hypothetical protein MASR1M65_02560 [Saprospiraceae bacterium]
MHKSFDKNSKNLKPTKKKAGLNNTKIKLNGRDDGDNPKSDVPEKPKKKVPKKFFMDDEDEISYRVKH